MRIRYNNAEPSGNILETTRAFYALDKSYIARINKNELSYQIIYDNVIVAIGNGKNLDDVKARVREEFGKLGVRL